MKLNPVFMRSAIAIALAGLIGVASAGEAGGNTTEIKLIGKGKKLETLKFEGELAVGDSRGLYTDAGTPVTVQRTDKGLRIETPERNVDVPYPDHDALAADGEEHIAIDGEHAHKRVVILHGDKDHAEHHAIHDKDHADTQMKRVIVIGNGGDVDVDVTRLADLADLGDLGELGALDDLDALGELKSLDTDGDKRVIVIRKVDKKTVQAN